MRRVVVTGAAPSTLHPLPTLERIEALCGRLPATIDRAHYRARPFAPIFDIGRAARMLGWRPRHDHRTSILAPERSMS